MSSRTSQWRYLNQQVLQSLENQSDQENERNNKQVEQTDCIENDIQESLESSYESQVGPLESIDSDSTMSESESISSEEDSNFLSELSSWSISQNISHIALNGLLKILRKHMDSNLPSDARTVLKTPRQVPVTNKCGGEFVHLGIKSGIMRRKQWQSQKKVSLLVNVDGLPIFKSSDLEVWPILGSVNGGVPFIISLWAGSGKPESASEFLKEFLEEYETLCQSGIEIGDTVVEFELKCFSCDAPARQFLKSIKGHTGYYSCERCTVKGERHEGTMTFEDLNSPLRTGKDFDELNYHLSHQHERSPLIGQKINCIKQFVLDSMHLVYLGVVKRIIYFLKEGPRVCKLSQAQLGLISSKLESLRNQLPSEFARQPRGLKHLKRWKATEFKQFLLYTGVYSLKGVVSEKCYEHFLSLTISISIMMYFKPTDADYMSLFVFAKELLNWFVDASPEIYGPTFVVYNVHNLVHLHQDVENFKCGLHELSAFPFENFLQRIKKMVRKSHQAISQVAKRVMEIEESNFEVVSKSIKMTIKPSVKSNRNSFFSFSNGKIGEVQEVNDDDLLQVKFYSTSRLQAYFEEPIDSKLLQIYFLPNNSIFKIENIYKSEIVRKYVCMPEETGILLIPMNCNLKVS